MLHYYSVTALSDVTLLKDKTNIIQDLKPKKQWIPTEHEGSISEDIYWYKKIVYIQ